MAAATSSALGVAAGLLIATAAIAEEAPAIGGGTVGNLKHLASDYGLMGLLLTLALSAIMALFSLYILERPKREAALAKQSEEHTKEIAAKDAAHAADRAEWHASTTLLQESRLALQREVLIAIERATAVMNATQGSITERTQSAGELVAQLSSLVSAIRDLRSNTAEELGQMRKTMYETGGRLDALSRHVKGGS